MARFNANEVNRKMREAQRRAQQKLKREVDRVNRANKKAVDDYNRKVDAHNKKVVADHNRRANAHNKKVIADLNRQLQTGLVPEISIVEAGELVPELPLLPGEGHAEIHIRRLVAQIRYGEEERDGVAGIGLGRIECEFHVDLRQRGRREQNREG